MEKGVAAEMLGDRHFSLPALAVAAGGKVLGANADGLRAIALRRLAADEVHARRADEPGDEEIGWPLVEFERRAALLDIAGIEHHDLVGHGHGFDLIVGDVDCGRGELPLQLGDLQSHLHAQRRVEIRQRLVEQEGFRLANNRPADRHALALAAGQLARLTIEIGREVERGGRRLDPAFGLVARQAGHLQPETDISAHAHVRVERVGLEHHREAALGRRHADDVHAVDQDAAAAHVLEPGNQAQQRGLAASRGTDKDNERPVGDIEVGTFDDGVGSERLAHAFECDAAHGLFPAYGFLRLTVAAHVALFDGAEGQPAHELPLTEPAKNKDRRDGERRSGGELRPEQALGAGIGGDKDGERRRLRG